MSHLTKEEAKDAFKEAIKEWLDEQFIKFGKLTFYSLLALILSTATYFALNLNGWVKVTK